jgi:hypothetical protein
MTAAVILDELWSAASSVLTAVLPLAVLFLLFQLLLLRLPYRDFRSASASCPWAAPSARLWVA